MLPRSFPFKFFNTRPLLPSVYFVILLLIAYLLEEHNNSTVISIKSDHVLLRIKERGVGTRYVHKYICYSEMTLSSKLKFVLEQYWQ
jgi:hypothetical protein